MAYRIDRSYAWNYGHRPALPRPRRLAAGAGGHLLGYQLNSRLGVAAGPLLNSKWVDAYARLGWDLLTYATVRSQPHPAHPLPNVRWVEYRPDAAVGTRSNGPHREPTLAVSLGLPSMPPEVWRKDLRRARERLGPGQVLIVSVVGTATADGDAEAFVADYARCAAWAAEAGAHIVEVHLAVPNPFGGGAQLVYEHVPLSARILHRVRTSVPVPVVAKLGLFRSPRALHETASSLSPWAHGFTLVHAIPRRTVDGEGNPLFAGDGRDWADVVGAATYPQALRQIEEMLAWRKAGAWPHAVLAVGGITTVDRALHVLAAGADVTLAATAALLDPLLATRFRASVAASAA